MSGRFQACFERARDLREGGRLAEAVAAYEEALVLRPDSLAAHFNRANALQAMDRHAEAVAGYERLLAAAPDDALALNNRAVSLAALGRAADALASCDAALALRPDYPEALNNRGNALAALGRLGEALACIDRALALRPREAAAWSSRGRVLQQAGRHEDALQSFTAAVRWRPGDAGTLCDQGVALQALGRYAEALDCFGAAAAADRASIAAHTNRGNALVALARHQEALDSYAAALALGPDDPEVLWNMGLARLATGDYAAGWPLYEQRSRVPSLQLPPRMTGVPRWQRHEELMARSVLLHAEQGFGDAIQFVRFARELAARGAQVTLACAPALQRLFTRADGVAHVIVPGREALPALDFHLPLMSVPAALRTAVDALPRPPYLTADPVLVRAWDARLPEGRRVGLAWSGNPDFAAARLKACPPHLLAPLAATPGCRFVSLQVGAGREEAGMIGPDVVDAPADLGDFADTAALVETLDLVITIDTAVAHLAGALGKPVWILLPFAADWRWLVGRDDSPWYPSARLYRQRRPGDWADPLARMAQDLLQWSGHGG
jgi:tetratricopeptide (TPR) repeat protein